MRAVRLVLGWSLRTQWRSLLLLVGLIALTGGATLASWGASRRTNTAVSRMLAATNSFDYVVGGSPLSSLPPGTLRRLPGVISDQSGYNLAFDQITTGAGVSFTMASAIILAPVAPSHPYDFRPRIVAGHAPDPADPDQVLADYQMGQTEGIHPGSVLTVYLYGPNDGTAASAGGPPSRPPVKLTVTGLGVSTIALQSGQPFGYLLTTPAFIAQEGSQVLSLPGDLIRFANPSADQARFEQALARLPGVAPDLSNLQLIPADGFNAQVQASIHPQAQGWLVIAAFAALAGIIVVGQAFRRQLASGTERLQALRALGMTPGDLGAQGVVVAAAVGIAGAAAAVVLAYALSPLAPIGVARVAEPNPGLRFDALVLLGGGSLVAATPFVLGAVAALWQAARLRPNAGRDAGPLQRRPSLITGWLGRVGASPSALIGSRYALEAGGGRGSASSGTAILGTTVGVTAVAAAVVFAASLGHLLATPQLYGNAFALQGGPNSQSAVSDQQFAAVLAAVARLPGIDQISLAASGEVQAGSNSFAAIAVQSVEGPLAVTIARGRYPQGTGEVALGANTMRTLHAHIGSTVSLTAGGSPARLRVVGQVVLPVTAGAGNGGLGDGVALSLPGLEALTCPPGTPASACTIVAQAILVGFAHTAAGAAGVNQALTASNDPSSLFTLVLPYSPETLVNFGQAINFPLLVASIVVLFGAASLAHVLVVGLARRRQEVGTLKSIGFVRRQVAAMVGWQAATVMAVALVIGIPFGIVAGRAVWDAFTAYFGVETYSVVPWAEVALIAAGGLLLAELIAVAPGIVAARRSPAALLRTDA